MSMRIWLLVTMLALLMGLVVLGGQQASAATYPDVSGLQPFTVEAQYMSLPGYLRWQTFLEQGSWISHSEAVTAVQDQMRGA